MDMGSIHIRYGLLVGFFILMVMRTFYMNTIKCRLFYNTSQLGFKKYYDDLRTFGK